MTPYFSAQDRARVLYRIPASTAGKRVLEVCLGRDPLFLSVPGDDSDSASAVPGAGPLVAHTALRCYESCESGDVADNPRPASESFDLVVLHRTLDDLSALAPAEGRGAERRLLAEVADLLAPGGMIAGAMSNVGNAPWLLRQIAGWVGVPRRRAHAADHSMRELSALLASSGFVDVRVFRLLPDCDSPLTLADVHPRVTRLMHRYEVGVGRTRLLSHVLKRLAVEIGFYRWFVGRSILFWARKPC